MIYLKPHQPTCSPGLSAFFTEKSVGLFHAGKNIYLFTGFMCAMCRNISVTMESLHNDLSWSILCIYVNHSLIPIRLLAVFR